MDRIKQPPSTLSNYQALYQHSIAHPQQFWADQAEQLISWFSPWEHVMSGSLEQGNLRWFDGATLNASYNCIDRHLPEKADKVALLWESDEGETRKITYRQLHQDVSKLANVLKQYGVKRGDRVCIYLPMIPEAVYAMLACTRIGAIHSVVFGGFSAAALRNRILDADCQLVITADEGLRGGRTILLKQNVDEALADCPKVHTTVVVQRTASHNHDWHETRDVWYHQAVAKVTAECPPIAMAAEDPLFILYTSGSTGMPKGVLHTTGGYLVYTTLTFRQVFDYQDDDVYWCTADVGWITGHSYIVYGPLANGATTVLFEGIPNHPTPSRCWQIVDKHQVSIFYTAPTAIRSLMRESNGYVTACNRRSLRLLGTVGEPINPEVWQWYYTVVGEQRCPVVDTWWQTETGGIMIAPLPAITPLKPGSATQPLLAIQAALVDDEGQLLSGANEGKLVITQPWPGIMRTIYGDHQRFIDTYLSAYPGYYFTGDNARRDSDGYYWITGRVDDVINSSGHRLGTAEIESAIVAHPAIAEAAVVGVPHPLKGEAIYAFVTPLSNIQPDKKLQEDIIQSVRHEIGAIASPHVIQWAPALPKTRSGKIMRRILRCIAANDLSHIGDTSTLADANVVNQLIAERAAMTVE